MIKNYGCILFSSVRREFMKKIVFLTIFLLLPPAVTAPGGYQFGIVLFLQSAAPSELANQNKTGLYVNSIERMMRLDDDQIDLATAALLLSHQAGADINYRRYRRQVDDMAYAVLDKLAEQELEPDHRAIRIINQHLFEELGFKAVKTADDPKDLFLHYVLDRKKGYCLSLSVLYLSIGERLGLPLYGVVVPEHFFVRYDDGHVRFNIETTSQGNTPPDKHYLAEFDVPTGADSIYMKNLSKKETLSCFFNNLGNIYQGLGDVDSALILLERAVKITPQLAMVHTNLGNLYLKQGRTEDAIYEYRTALEIHPDEAKTHNNLGNAYFTLAQKPNDAFDVSGPAAAGLDAAVFEYTLALRLDPNYVDTYKNLARVYIKQDWFEEAIMQLNEAMVLEPKDSTVYRLLGDAYREMGDSSQAITNYNKALLLKADSVEAYYGLALTYRALGLLDEEIGAYKQLLNIGQSLSARKPERQRSRQYILGALQNLGTAYIDKRMYDAAIEQFKKAVSIKPDDAVLHYNLGVVYSKKQNYASAAAEYSAAVKLKADLAAAHNGLAACYYFLEKYDLAWKHINTARQLGFEIPEDLYRILSMKRK